MGSRTNGMSNKRVRTNLRRLGGKKVLTAAQHKYVDDLQHARPQGSPKPKSTHHCAFCGTGGHLRGGSPIKAPNGVLVRI